MGGGMSKIVPGIYVGGLASAKSKLQLDTNQITHLCSALREMGELDPRGREQLIIPVNDSPTEDLARYFEEACFFIHGARVSGGAVLIHCACGISRSVTLTLAYLLVVTEFSLADLFKAVQGARHCACPNDGFIDQLLKFEKIKHILQEKLFSRYGNWPEDSCKSDERALLAVLDIQNHFIEHGVYPGESSSSSQQQQLQQQQQQQQSGSSSRTMSVGEVIQKDLPTVCPLKQSYFTVYTGDKPRDLNEFLASRRPPSTG